MLSLQSKSVEGRCETHHDGAKPLEGVHFWKPNVAKVCKGAAVPTTMAPNHWKVFAIGMEMLQTCGRELQYQHDGAKPLEGVHFWSGNEAKVLEGIAKRLPWEGKCSQSVGR